MAAMGWQGLIMMFALGGAGMGGDLLDFAPTGAYWQANEQRVVDLDTMSAVLADKEATQADQLMAIRALGELAKAGEADKAAVIKQLTPLVDSKEPFVGRYAKRSLAWANGVEPELAKGVDPAKLEADLALLPHTSQIVGQMRMSKVVGPADWGKIIPDMPGMPPEARDEMMKEMGSGITEFVSKVGNIQLDSISLGVTFLENQGDDGYIAVVARGKYDRIGVQIALQDEMGDDEAVSFYSVGDIEVMTNKAQHGAMALIMPSDEQLILLFVGDGGDGFNMLPVDETIDLVKKGDAEFAFNDVVTEQISKIDRKKAQVWAVAKPAGPLLTEMAEVTGGLSAIRMSAVPGEGDMMDVKWFGKGKDKQLVADTVKMLNESLAEGKAEMNMMIQQAPQMKAMFGPMLEIMNSIEVKDEEGNITGGMKLPTNLGGMMSGMFMGIRQGPGGF